MIKPTKTWLTCSLTKYDSYDSMTKPWLRMLLEIMRNILNPLISIICSTLNMCQMRWETACPDNASLKAVHLRHICDTPTPCPSVTFPESVWTLGKTWASRVKNEDSENEWKWSFSPKQPEKKLLQTERLPPVRVFNTICGHAEQDIMASKIGCHLMYFDAIWNHSCLPSRQDIRRLESAWFSICRNISNIVSFCKLQKPIGFHGLNHQVIQYSVSIPPWSTLFLNSRRRSPNFVMLGPFVRNWLH